MTVLKLFTIYVKNEAFREFFIDLEVKTMKIKNVLLSKSKYE